MRWPWVCRSTMEQAIAREREVQLELAEAAAREVTAAGARAALAEANARTAEAWLAESKAERRTLVDRIVQLSGQPPLYEKAPAPVAQAPAADNAPPVRTQVKIDDVHAAARAAIADGTFDISKARVG